MADPFDFTLTTEEIRALCQRLALPIPVAVTVPVPPEAADPPSAEEIEVALAGLALRGVVAYERGSLVDADRAGTVLRALSAPEILIRMERKDSTSAAGAFIAVKGERAAEHRPLTNGTHRLVFVRTGEVVTRIVGFCGLLDRPVHELTGFTVTSGQLLQVAELVARGEAREAAAVLSAGNGGGPPDPSRAMFLRALESRPAAVYVAVLANRGDGRVEGTVTGWLDGGEAGLWRVPPIAGPQSGEVDAPDRAVHDEGPVELRPTSKADVIDEITEGFPELRRI